jgi:hypothetical protein
VSRSAGGPVTGIRAFRHMLGAIGPQAVVEGREARPVGTVYRSDHSKRIHTAGAKRTGTPLASTNDAG